MTVFSQKYSEKNPTIFGPPLRGGPIFLSLGTQHPMIAQADVELRVVSSRGAERGRASAPPRRISGPSVTCESDRIDQARWIPPITSQSAAGEKFGLSDAQAVDFYSGKCLILYPKPKKIRRLRRREAPTTPKITTHPPILNSAKIPPYPA